MQGRQGGVWVLYCTRKGTEAKKMKELDEPSARAAAVKTRSSCVFGSLNLRCHLR
jgi:hypothetical protein